MLTEVGLGLGSWTLDIQVFQHTLPETLRSFLASVTTSSDEETEPPSLDIVRTRQLLQFSLWYPREPRAGCQSLSQR